ncbi:hypothetical protein DXT63_09810 [Thermoanaerobacteraceae bacterium SP2]|nr:hypothetical protein DXT63_09810 [Thermoanaerobacteraceae bacterium SP2]
MLGEQLQKLYNFQELEKQSEKMESALKNHPGKKELLTLRKTIEQAETSYNQRCEKMEAIKKELARAELKSKELDDEMKLLEKKIYGGEIKTMKELSKLQEKQNAVRKSNEENDDRALKLIEELEDLKKTLSAEKQEIVIMKREYNQKRLKTLEEIDKINLELERVNEEKKQLKNNISSELLDKYEKVKKQKKEPVAFILNGKCSGCRMDVSVMVIREVNRHESLVYCESCGRILI